MVNRLWRFIKYSLGTLFFYQLTVRILAKVFRRWMQIPAPAILGYVLDSGFRKWIEPPEQVIQLRILATPLEPLMPVNARRASLSLQFPEAEVGVGAEAGAAVGTGPYWEKGTGGGPASGGMGRPSGMRRRSSQLT